MQVINKLSTTVLSPLRLIPHVFAGLGHRGEEGGASGAGQCSEGRPGVSVQFHEMVFGHKPSGRWRRTAVRRGAQRRSARVTERRRGMMYGSRAPALTWSIVRGYRARYAYGCVMRFDCVEPGRVYLGGWKRGGLVGSFCAAAPSSVVYGRMQRAVV